jgi:RimJ/RimL family protein N-acetyltransferase
VLSVHPLAAYHASPGSRSLILCLVRQKKKSRFESITIREVESSDLETFYEHQLDPEAIRMAAFVCEDPKDKVAFAAHWNKILNSSQITQSTIVAEGQVAGHISCYPHGDIEVTYWLGREFWGRGLATQALNRMLHLVVDRPEKTKISPMAEAKTRKNTFFAWISIKQMNELA